MNQNITVILGALAIAVAGTTHAESIYVDPDTSAPWTNIYAPGNYYWGGSSFTQNIGVVTGNAFVEASWGVSPAFHTDTAQYSFNGGAAVTINQKYAWNQANQFEGAWSGFGGPGAGVYSLTEASTLSGTATAVSTTRVTPITGTIVRHADQTALNTAWTGTVGVSTPGGDGYRFAIGSSSRYFYYAPGLTGTFNLEISWGIGTSVRVPTASWYLDPNGTGNVLDYVPILTNFYTGVFSDGVNRTIWPDNSPIYGGTYWGQWSGFMSVGNVTLNANSLIVYSNDSGESVYGTVSDLQLTATGGGYSAWASGFTNPTLSDTTSTADPDFDGLTNAVEYALGLDPRFSSGSPGVISNNGRTITFTKGADAKINGDVTYQIETSISLGAEPTPWAVNVTDVTNGLDSISITFPTPGPAKDFARLKVTLTTP